MKFTICLIAFVAADYVRRQGYPLVAWLIVIVAFWEAVGQGWWQIIRSRVPRNYPFWRKNVKAARRNKNRFLATLDVLGCFAVAPFVLLLERPPDTASTWKNPDRH